MPGNAVRYNLDRSGASPANRIVDEIHQLSTSPIRLLVPNYGAFFTESVIIIDNQTQLPLVAGVDYHFSELVQEETLLTGKEICTLILITNDTASNDVRVTYQLLGDKYTNYAISTHNIYQALLQDKRPVDWMTGVINKQDKYPPTWHPHHVNDTYGYGALVYAVDRVTTAIKLGNSSVLEAYRLWVEERLAAFQLATYADIDSDTPSSKMVTVDVLKYAIDQMAGNKVHTFTPLPPVYDANTEIHTVPIRLDTLGYTDGTVLYYSVKSIDGDGNFINPEGTILLIDGSGTIALSIPNAGLPAVNDFNIVVRRRSQKGVVVARSATYTLGNFVTFKVTPMHKLVRVYHRQSVKYRRSARAMFMSRI